MTTVATYLFTRLRQLGVQSIFGVPGDYNLRLLDFVDQNDLHWVGNCNELNAAYAADAYARIKGLGAIITTFGVGELSAINGIAGAYAERSPVVHIVGTPSRDLQNAKVKMHHTFADGDYRRFAQIHSHVTVAQANLLDVALIPDQIDWILLQAMVHSRPVYLEIPDDVATAPVSPVKLTKRLTLPVCDESAAEEEILEEFVKRVASARQPVILVDGESRGMNILQEVDMFVKRTGWPTWTTIFGKGLVNEQLPNSYGIYTGRYGDGESHTYVQSSDLIVFFGPHLSDTNTQNFTTIPSEDITVGLCFDRVHVGARSFRNVPAKRMVQAFLDRLSRIDIPTLENMPSKQAYQADASTLDRAGPLVQKHFYRFVNNIFQESDIILTETGTAAHGGRSFLLPEKASFFTAVTWLSIGYMLPATLGATLARRDSDSTLPAENDSPRAILFVGDGSLQMSIQELSTIIKERLNVIVVIINNDGYTIERAIHGRNQKYNDIASWRHLDALSFFNAPLEHVKVNQFYARTWGELGSVLASPGFQSGTGVRILEVFMGREDCQGSLLAMLEKQVTQDQRDAVAIS